MTAEPGLAQDALLCSYGNSGVKGVNRSLSYSNKIRIRTNAKYRKNNANGEINLLWLTVRGSGGLEVERVHD